MSAKLNNIAFFGTSDFGIPALNYLIESKHAPILVVTQPDRGKGRGQKINHSPIKEIALKHQLPILQPESVSRDLEFAKELQKINCDLLIVVAYGQILPPWLLDWPKIAALNFHGSLLPKYRGAAPIQWSIIRGERLAGVTLMKMVSKLDAGNIIEQRPLNITPNETYGELQTRLAELTPNLLENYVTKLERGETPKELNQKESEVTWAPLIKTADRRIDWSKSATEIHNLVRGLNPQPLAVTKLNGKQLKCLSSQVSAHPHQSSVRAGTVIDRKPTRVVVNCGVGTLEVSQVIPENRGSMPLSAYLQGLQSSAEVCFAE